VAPPTGPVTGTVTGTAARVPMAPTACLAVWNVRFQGCRWRHRHPWARARGYPGRDHRGSCDQRDKSRSGARRWRRWSRSCLAWRTQPPGTGFLLV